MLKMASTVFISAASLATVSCMDKNKSRAEVDEKILFAIGELNPGYSISEYSRYYVLSGTDKIEGVYIVYHKESRAYVKLSCEQDEVTAYPCEQLDYGVIASGDVLWLDSKAKLPLRAGGGCSFIQFTFDIAENKLKDAHCNAKV